MKKVVILLMSLTVSLSACAQKKPKIKGNKIVTDIFNSLEDFNAVEIGDNLTVHIMQSGTNGYHLKADANLTDVVQFDILNGVLKIYTTHKITAYKDLEIALTFDELESITLKNDARLVSKNRLDFEGLDFQAHDESKYDLDVKVTNGQFKLYRSTKGELNLKGDYIDFYLDQNAFLKGEVIADKVIMNINDRADIDLDGDVNTLKLQTSGTSDVKAKKLKSTYAELNASNSSDIYVYASKELKLYAQGKSQIYVYGNPNIQIEGLNDKSQIIKKS